MDKNTIKTGNINIDFNKAENTTINVDNSVKIGDVNKTDNPKYDNKILWDTKTRPIYSVIIGLIAIIADLIGIYSFFTSGMAFEPKYSLLFNIVCYGALPFALIFFISLYLLSKEYLKFIGGISFIKRKGKILIMKINGDCTICGGKLEIAQTGDSAYCKRNPKHKFEFDYTKID